MTMEELKVYPSKEKVPNKYFIEMPKRMKRKDGHSELLVKIKHYYGEYQYIPYTFKALFLNDSFTSDELRALANKLDELNSAKLGRNM